ncbi:hypothetical protein DAPPUDRAFT_106245 [Daphnia pulex]|uniref:Uncharacterized protein n=1 Tax=Daphnia pulex TaxID=6669 RepID=E9GT18_DAPPU|nr:hypothetical protein DAPPUDRAFT_106245 [Daphnia pulex]|eukprot:EFX77352.1 hypothetical protein DAPPUDRAFT_106245 [Daphnia pulex]
MPETDCNFYFIIEQKLNELAKRKADIELLQKVLDKGKRDLTLEEQGCISKYDEVVFQLELTKNFLKTFDEKNSKTEGDVERTMIKTRTSGNIQTTSTSFLLPDSMDDQRSEILRLRKLLGEAEKKGARPKKQVPLHQHVQKLCTCFPNNGHHEGSGSSHQRL